MSAGVNLLGEGGNLRGGLPDPENDLRKPLSNAAVMVDLRKAHVRKGLVAKGSQKACFGGGRVGLAVADLFENAAEVCRCHVTLSPVFS